METNKDSNDKTDDKLKDHGTPIGRTLEENRDFYDKEEYEKTKEFMKEKASEESQDDLLHALMDELLTEGNQSTLNKFHIQRKKS